MLDSVDMSHPFITDDRIKALPKLPGVYLMKDRKGEVIYVGKAKVLRARVRSYFRGGDGRTNVKYLVEKIAELETVVTQDERQALVLESDLIKKFKPRYNVRLKDDKAYLIVRIDTDEKWPRLQLVRKAEEDGARYIGPFTFAWELRMLLDLIRKTVPLRTCSDTVFNNRVRPCLEYQIKRCAGPCCLEVDKAQYQSWIEQAVAILQGKNAEVVKSLGLEMEYASNDLRFEDAAAIRDRIEVLKKLNDERPALQFGEGSRDAFGLYRDGERLELSVLMVRFGRLFGAKTFGFSDVSAENEDILASLMTQFYSGGNDIPEEILIPFKLEDQKTREEFYSDERGRKVSIHIPQRGPKQKLLSLAGQNARENFNARFGTAAEGEDALRVLQKELGLEEAPRTIECADISHFQGGSTVGSIVLFQDGKPDKTRYRHFHLSQEGKPDDFASMHEIVMRHLSRGAEENTLSDLMVIDGGMQQLAQALKVREELGLRRPMMIGLAKKRTASAPYRARQSLREPSVTAKPERVFLEGEKVPVVLAPGSKALNLLEQIRDEAHRFAITFHRQTRARKVFKSDLDSIPGIGPKRRRELLRAYGSVRKIKEASAKEIAERCAMPLSLAKRMLDLLARKAKS